jgi:hypothetical protein
MTNIIPGPGDAAPPVSMNDTLPSGNPSLKTVLIAASCVVAVVLVLIFRSSLGF